MLKEITAFRNVKGDIKYEFKVLSRPKNVLMKF